MIKNLNRLLVVFLIAFGIYHLLMYCVMHEILLISVTKLYWFYHIIIDSSVIALIAYLIESYIFPRWIYITLPYFGAKVLYHVLSYIPNIRALIKEIDLDFLLAPLVGLIIIVLIPMSLFKKNDC